MIETFLDIAMLFKLISIMLLNVLPTVFQTVSCLWHSYFFFNSNISINSCLFIFTIGEFWLYFDPYIDRKGENSLENLRFPAFLVFFSSLFIICQGNFCEFQFFFQTCSHPREGGQLLTNGGYFRTLLIITRQGYLCQHC